MEERGILFISKNRDEAEKVLRIAKRIYAEFNVFLVDLSNPEERICAIDIDPDLGDFKEGYAVVVSVS